MKNRVHFWASARDAVQTSQTELEIEEELSVASIEFALGQQFPQHLGLWKSCAFAIDDEYLIPGQWITGPKDIDVIPPVSGG